MVGLVSCCSLFVQIAGRMLAVFLVINQTIVAAVFGHQA
jgi:hypothetical protein